MANNYDALNEAKIEDMRYYFDDDWFDIPNPGEAIARSLHARALNRGTVNQPLRCSKCKKVYHKKIRPTPGTELYEYLDQGTFGNLRMRVEVCWKCE